ncbi:gliding motility-associated-like protein [Chitinophaga skermanii]|uniref:Gliding motility-associated-like protein n=1 Tax=Chitinophaga skermanii TaxID=331697 RepID=A0A327QRN7_9BACT|nr:PKD domain-containing protein [Chitinophaga skermanii]RAJ06565.1 gliding motility-associated-like protein [Chitinophaga skermanii]
MNRIVGILFSMLLLCQQLNAQLQTPYILNGTATQNTCNCYTLTQDQSNSSGTVWNKTKIDLTQSFNYVFEVNLGCKDESGADGIGFILQTQGTNLGATGQGLGFKGISPSLGVLIDTWQNSDESDPSYDHLAIQQNGLSNHSDVNGNLAGPVQVIDGVDNIEDCKWHLLRVEWDAPTTTLIVSVDQVERLRIQKDLVTDIFYGDPNVYWGFGGSTGGSSNKQQFCAALHPAFSFNSAQILCEGTPVQFYNASSSFGSITRYWWDLGDGTITTDPVPALHQYPGAGKYPVKMVIEDNSGCVSDTMRTDVTISSYPVVDFGPSVLCEGTLFQMQDLTKVAVGDLGTYHWDFNNGETALSRNAVAPYTALGFYQINLQVTTLQGCTSQTTKTVQVAPTPVIQALARNTCFGDQSEFTGVNLTPTIPISSWNWELGNGASIMGQHMNYTYPAYGKYTATLRAASDLGCAAKPVTSTFDIISLRLTATSDTTVAMFQPLQLQSHAFGNNVQYTWQPSMGLNDATIPNPVASLQADQIYRIIVTTPEGCREEDEIKVKVYAGPEFYVPNAFTPNNDGRNDIFKVIAPGVPALDYFRIWNRWGQEIFYTKDLRVGWDGTIKGMPADAGNYIWMVQGKDYTGRTFSRKGTILLLR